MRFIFRLTSKSKKGSYMLTTGACSSLIIGYGAGVVWLLRNAE